MKNVQVPQQLFMKLLRYHLLDDDSCADDVKKGLEQKMNTMWNVNYIRNQKPLQQRKNGKKLARSIWTGEEYRLTFDGNSSLDAI